MASFNNNIYTPPQSYAPSAPALPPDYPHQEPNEQTLPSSSSPQSSHSHASPALPENHKPEDKLSTPKPNEQMHTPSSSSFTNPQPHLAYSQSLHQQHPLQHQSSYGYGYSAPPPTPTFGGYFPPGTHPEVIRSFQLVDKDRSGFIDDKELQEALSFSYQKFSLRTVQLLIYLFTNPIQPSLQMGPIEFAALWKCLGEWRAIFERFDRDRSGKIDTMELRDALYSIGYAVPPSVLQVLISKYEDGSNRTGGLNFDSFVECGMIIKGLTEKFKAKDPRYTGSATLNYETFLSMVIPFIVP